MQFIETRGNDGQHPEKVSFSEAILAPISSYGGIYSPESLPVLGDDFFSSHISSDYKTLARAVLTAFDIDINAEIIDKALALYDDFDDSSNPVPVVKVKDDLFVSELWHGPTRAFKDMALQPFGIVLSSIAQERNEHYLILAATSGDTGPAALETFKNKANVMVACMYPEGGTSDVQRLQMVTEDAANLKVIGVKGDFDDTQSALKHLLASKAFKNTLKERTSCYPPPTRLISAGSFSRPSTISIHTSNWSVRTRSNRETRSTSMSQAGISVMPWVVTTR
jgi:threonine synthase